MWTDAVDLRDFYDSGLGVVARRMICRAIRAHWPDLGGMDVLGLGFPTPYLNGYLGQARRIADEILFLHRGRLLESSSADEFFPRPRTQEATAFVEGNLLW